MKKILLTISMVISLAQLTWGLEKSNQLCEAHWWKRATVEQIKNQVERVGEEEFINTRCGEQDNSYLHLATLFSKRESVVARLIDMGFYPEEGNGENQSAIDLDQDKNNGAFRAILNGANSQKNLEQRSFKRPLRKHNKNNKVLNKNVRYYVGFGAGIGSPIRGKQEGTNRDTICYPSSVCFVDPTITPGPGYIWRYDLEGKKGLIGQLFLGYIAGPFRVELSVDQSRNKISGYHFNETVDLNENPVVPDRDDSIIQSTIERGIDKIDISSTGFNLYYDLRNKTPITPYVGAGLGWSAIDIVGIAYTHKKRDVGPNPEQRSYDPPLTFYNVERGNYPVNDVVHYWKLHAGADFNISEKTTLGFKASYSDYGEVEYVGRYKIHPMNLAGSNFNFSEKFFSLNGWTWTIILKRAFQ